MMLVSEATEARDERTDRVSERRRGLRIRRNHPIKVYEPNLGRYFGGQTTDISSTGLRVELPASAPVRPGRILTIYIAATEGRSMAHHRQMQPVRIIWTDRVSQCVRGRLIAGVEFLSSLATQRDAA
jgi:hypothetical protein